MKTPPKLGRKKIKIPHDECHSLRKNLSSHSCPALGVSPTSPRARATPHGGNK